MTRPTANVSIIEYGKPLPDAPGNLMLVDDPTAMAEEKGAIEVQWMDQDTLTIRFEKARNVVKRVERFDRIIVQYSTK
jgi:hypothetical protein